MSKSFVVGPALVLITIVLGGPSGAAVTAAPGYVVRTIPTPSQVQGGVVRRGDAIFVGQGPTFTGGAESVIRFEEGGAATTIATAFNALGGFDVGSDGTLYVVDNGFEAPGAASGDTLYAIPNAVTRTTAVGATAAEVLPPGTIDTAYDVLVVPGAVLVSDAVGPGVGRVIRVTSAGATNLITGLDYVAGLCLDNNTLLVGNVDGSLVGSIHKYDLTGAPMGALVNGLSGNADEVLDGDGNVLVSGGNTSDFSSSTVVAVDAMGALTERASGFAFSGGMFFDAVRNETLVLDFGVSQITALCRDADQNGVCDADEPCGFAVENAKLVVKKLGAPAGDQTFTFKGQITLPTPFALDPVVRGLRVRLATALGATTEVTLPPGGFDESIKSGWKANKMLTAWTFASPTPIGPLGITKVSVKIASKLPGLIRFAAKGKGGTIAVAPVDLPLAATLALDPVGHCGTVTFMGGQGACVFNANQTRVSCK